VNGAGADQAMPDAAAGLLRWARRRPNGEQDMSSIVKLLIGLLALLALPSLSACNTARGMGEDVQALGRAMTGTAEDVEEDISGEPDADSEAKTQ
jgi:predicted small secreted protein